MCNLNFTNIEKKRKKIDTTLVRKFEETSKAIKKIVNQILLKHIHNEKFVKNFIEIFISPKLYNTEIHHIPIKKRDRGSRICTGCRRFTEQEKIMKTVIENSRKRRNLTAKRNIFVKKN